MKISVHALAVAAAIGLGLAALAPAPASACGQRCIRAGSPTCYHCVNDARVTTTCVQVDPCTCELFSCSAASGALTTAEQARTEAFLATLGGPDLGAAAALEALFPPATAR